jgi:hypothetical protein
MDRTVKVDLQPVFSLRPGQKEDFRFDSTWDWVYSSLHPTKVYFGV